MATATAPKQRIATIKGVWVKPGISKNRRYYRPEHIAAAVEEAQAQIESGNGPVVFGMMTHHGARDHRTGDVTRTAGRVTKVSLNDQGYGVYEAELADTQAGRDVAALVTPEKPYLKGNSMASVWKSEPKAIMAPDGSGPCETSDDGFTFRGIDFTHSPGIDGAEITSAELAEAAGMPGLILEAIEEEVFMESVDEATAVIEAGTTSYADPGYRGEKCFPMGTATAIRESWVQVHCKSVTEAYSPKQVRRMRGKLAAQAKKVGFDIIAETAALGTEILEAYTSVCVDNGPADLRVSAYVDDPAKLQAVTQKVAMAAMAALYSLDPDNDGDIDLPGGDSDDDVMPCPSCSADCPIGAFFCPTCGQAIPTAESAPTEKEPIVGTESQTTGAANESTLSITQTQLDEAVAAGAKAALEAAGVKPTEAVEESEAVKAARKLIAETDGAAGNGTETTTATTATTEAVESAMPKTKAELDALITEAATAGATAATEAIRSDVVKQIRESGPQRRGFVSKDILEQDATEVYGEGADLSKMSTGDLEKLTDKVVSPLIGA